MKKFVSLLLVFALVFSLAACMGAQTDPDPCTDEDPVETKGPEAQTDGAVPGTAAPLSSVEDYGALFETIRKVYDDIQYNVERGDMIFYGTVTDDAAPMEPESAPAAGGSNSSADAAESEDYSGTNTQVEGVDEGDIVKTDGKYIYVLKETELVILRANGGDTEVVSRLALGQDEYIEQDNYYYSRWRWPNEMYVLDDRLAIISSAGWSEHRQTGDMGAWTYNYESWTAVDIIDIGDVEAPAVIATSGQDGNYLASRLVGGSLYLVTNHYLSGDPVEGEPETFVPCLYRGEERRPVPAGDIFVMPETSSTVYTVAAGYDMTTGESISTQSVLGGGSTVYMDGDTLYIAGTRYVHEETELGPDDSGKYARRREEGRNETDIVRMEADGGVLTVTGTVSVPGWLESQFSMDEHGGYLRVVTTMDGYDHTYIYDPETGYYVSSESSADLRERTNGLYILNEDLETVGSIDGLAEGERVYSVRFMGDIVYFVTFRETDPLFAVDISDPAAPEILSELKIPGFSEYLHPWDDGLLLGLGQNTVLNGSGSGVWVTTAGMKLSMFDTSDPRDVSEKHTLALTSCSSEALYNHRAILVSKERNLIAFPTDSGYAVYGYSEAEGFSLRVTINCAWEWNARGLYIGSFFYVVSPYSGSVTVLDLDTLTAVGETDF